MEVRLPDLHFGSRSSKNARLRLPFGSRKPCEKKKKYIFVARESALRFTRRSVGVGSLIPPGGASRECATQFQSWGGESSRLPPLFFFFLKKNHLLPPATHSTTTPTCQNHHSTTHIQPPKPTKTHQKHHRTPEQPLPTQKTPSKPPKPSKKHSQPSQITNPPHKIFPKASKIRQNELPYLPKP